MVAYGTGPFSTTSHGSDAPGMFRARIEAIDDPQKRNRVQIRVFGYQDDQGNISKDQLEWVHCSSHDSQVAGATSTHGYYPGSEVFVMNTGTEKMIMGSVPGFDSENRLSQNPWGVDSSQNQNPDVPNVTRSNQQDTAIRSSPGLIDAAGGSAGTNNYFNYQSWQNLLKQMMPYSTGKGAPPAPWGQGQTTKQDQLQSIALQPNQNGSDVLNVINQLDGNMSGSVKQAIQIIQNLRNNGFGNAMDVIGSGPVNAALSQYTNQFGSYTQNSLITLLQQLLQYIQVTQSLSDTNFYTNCQNGTVSNIITFLGNINFVVATDTLNDMQNNVLANVILSNGNANISYYNTQYTQFLGDFNSAVSQGFTAVLIQINSIASTAGDVNSFVTIFGGSQSFITFAQTVNSIGLYVGMPQTAINNIGLGSIGLALGGGLQQISTPNPTQPTNSNSNSNNNNSLIGLLAMFTGNPIALQEIMGGGLIKKFLSGNPVKYQQKQTNDGMAVLKMFKDGVSGS